MAANSKCMTLTDDNFQDKVLGSPERALVDFWAGWCAPCHIIAPVIEELAAEFDGRITVGKLDIDRNTKVAMQYGIQSIPSPQ